MHAAITRCPNGCRICRAHENRVTNSPEQICTIIALACSHAERASVALTRWTYSNLAEEPITHGITTSIAAYSVERFLRRGRPQG